MRTVIFGGSFDPIHVAHLTIAQRAKSAVAATQVLFVPTSQNPLKAQCHASAQQRLAMVHRACEHLPWAKVIDYEVKKPASSPSYTIDTLKYLQQQNIVEQQPYLLLGADSARGLGSWHQSAELLKFVQLLIVNRPGYIIPLEYPHKTLTIADLDISSSAIRQDCKEAFMQMHLSPKVWEYIQHEQLYR